MSSKHANARPSGERGIKGTAIYTLMLVLIASKYAMNVLVSSTRCWQISKCLSDSTGAHHVSNSILQTQRASFQKTMQRFRDLGKTDSHCQLYKVLHCMWLKCRPTAFTLSSGTHTRLALLHWGIEYKQPYQTPKNQTFPKLTGHFCSQHFIVWVWCENRLVRVEISVGEEAYFLAPERLQQHQNIKWYIIAQIYSKQSIKPQKQILTNFRSTL